MYSLESYASSSGILGISVCGRVVDATKTGARIKARNNCLKDPIVREDENTQMNGSWLDVEKTYGVVGAEI